MSELAKRENVRKVTVRINIDTDKRVHKSLVTSISRSFGPAYDRNTRTLLMGLSEDEREILLPPIIGVKPESENWEQAVKNFFSNLRIKPSPETGEELNIAMHPEKEYKLRDGRVIKYGPPVVPMDYIKYKQAIANTNLLGFSQEQATGENLPFFLEDTNSVREEKQVLQSLYDVLDRVYLKVTEKNDNGRFEKENKLNALLRVFNHNPAIMTDYEKVEAVDKLRSQDKETAKDKKNLDECKFYKTAIDRDLETMGFIYSCLSNQILTYIGDYIVDAEDTNKIIGRNVKQAVAWFKDEANNNDIMRYKALNDQKLEKLVQ